MKARISGRAACFAIKRAEGWDLGQRGRASRVRVEELDVNRALGGTLDVVEIEAKTELEVERRLEVEWAKHRALRLTIMLLDPNEALDGLDIVARLLEALLSKAEVIAFIENQFCQQELPTESELERSLSLAIEHPYLLGLFERFQTWQPTIERVSASFEALSPSLFGGDDEKAVYREQAIAAGAFRCLVKSTVDGKLPDSAIFELHAMLHDLRDARAIVKEWASAFERVSVELPLLPADWAEELDDDIADFGGGPGGYQRLRNALEQQHAILTKVADGDYENARKFARELAQKQLATNDRPYLAKSFTRLSQGAREMEAFELDLEWSHEAVDCKAGDARAHTQYADALLHADRYDEALEQYQLAGEFGERGYAATGYARVMRYLGRYEDALGAYADVALNFKNTEHEIYSLVGISNVKNDMGNLDDALSHAADVVERFPYEHVPRLNHAKLLARRGSFDEAWTEFVEAEKLSKHKLAALNGLADICRRTGKLDEARHRYLDIAERSPRSIEAHIGLIDTLRSLGEYKAAVLYARRTSERFPGSARAAARHAEMASLMGRHASARQLLSEAISRFPKDSRLALVRTAAYRREGRYDRALSTIDAAVERFPYQRHLALLRAEMLRRLGELDAAGAVYRRLVDEDQADTKARNGLASILILEGKPELAERLIENDNPVTADDWRSFLLKASLAERTGDIQGARERMQWAIDTCPFAVEARLFTTALAKLSAKSGHARKAPRIPNLPERDICNLISFHVAAMTKSPRARPAYAALSRNLPTQYEILRNEIARNYGVITDKPRHKPAWIARRLSDEFLLAAA